MAQKEAIEIAQGIITRALRSVHTHRKIVDDQEAKFYPPYQNAYDRLRYTLAKLPKDVTCISVQIEFAKVESEAGRTFPGWMGSQLIILKRYLKLIDPSTLERNPLDFVFVVKPNTYPEKLERLTHGSRTKDLATQVFETIGMNYHGNHFLVIKPFGAPDGMGEIWAQYPRPYNVPLQVVRGITLHKERKPLTPYLEGPGINGLQLVSTSY